MDVKEKIQVTKVGDVGVLAVEGTVTVRGESFLFQETIKKLLDQGLSKFVLNLAGIYFLDSMGIGDLVAANVMARGSGARICIANLPWKLRQLFDIMHLTKAMETYDSVEEAVSALTSSTNSSAIADV